VDKLCLTRKIKEVLKMTKDERKDVTRDIGGTGKRS
jgi:hypothetical protein